MTRLRWYEWLLLTVAVVEATALAVGFHRTPSATRADFNARALDWWRATVAR